LETFLRARRAAPPVTEIRARRKSCTQVIANNELFFAAADRIFFVFLSIPQR